MTKSGATIWLTKHLMARAFSPVQIGNWQLPQSFVMAPLTRNRAGAGNAPTQLMKDLEYGKNYRYAHDEEGGFAAGENYFPQGMAAPQFYRPVGRGLEIRIAEKLDELKKKNDQQS